jgi:hypothetical protein
MDGKQQGNEPKIDKWQLLLLCQFLCDLRKQYNVKKKTILQPVVVLLE